MMTWTKEKPTIPGWYWCRPVDGSIIMQYVSLGAIHWCIWTEGYNWAGPLEPPEEE